MLIGAGAEVGSATMEARSYGAILDDASIGTQIKGNLFNFSTSLFVDVNVTVKEGSVFLTGSVPSPKLRIQAVKIAWQSDGVREVKNEIQKQVRGMPGQEKMVLEYYQKNPSASQSLKGSLYEEKIIELIKSKINLTSKEIGIKEAEKIIAEFNKQSADPDKSKTTASVKNKSKTKKISKK